VFAVNEGLVSRRSIPVLVHPDQNVRLMVEIHDEKREKCNLCVRYKLSPMCRVAQNEKFQREVEDVANRFVIHNNMCYGSGIMSSNDKTISFRADAEKIEALDSLAAAQERPRSYLINEAITNYIELHAYQDALVRKGLEEMRKGRVVSHEQVLKGLKRTGRARQ
jgi:predicted transcriptional regulator